MADQNRDDRTEPTINDATANSESGNAKPAEPVATSSDVTTGQDKSVAPEGQAKGEIKPEAKPAAAEQPAAKTTGRHIMVLPPVRNGDWNARGEEAAAAQGATNAGLFGKRRLAALAAVFALAAVAGVIGGSLASTALGHRPDDKANAAAEQQVQALTETIGKLNAEVAALKTSAERSAKSDASQLAKIADRVEKVEKAQAEPAAKLAKLSETVEKLRVTAATPAAAPASAAAKENVKEATASIPTPVAAPNRAPEAHRLPTVVGWRIRNIGNGGALIEGREGLYEVYAGDPLPGLGRVDAIRKQDGRWVVVTSKGLIVAR
jgi:Asp-tRNA(Asn)/Glu-tRNA(Gln) amidotransferase C subunit